MYDVSLYGHLTFDRIFDGFKKDTCVGSMGNVWSALLNANPNLKIDLQPTDIGEALILVDKLRSERTSIACLNMKTNKPQIHKSKWNHILYLNKITDLSFIEDINDGIISADICRGDSLKDLNVLKKINFLFLADEDIFINIEKIVKLVKDGLILHSNNGSVCYMKDGSKFKTNVKVLDNINVLGCGDMLASFFINQYLKSNDFQKSIKNSHKLVSERLRKMVHEKV